MVIDISNEKRGAKDKAKIWETRRQWSMKWKETVFYLFFIFYLIFIYLLIILVGKILENGVYFTFLFFDKYLEILKIIFGLNFDCLISSQ